MIKLLEIKHNGVVVAEAPMIVHDVEGTRAAILASMEQGVNGISSEYLSLPLMACSAPVDAPDYVGVYIFTQEAAEDEATA